MLVNRSWCAIEGEDCDVAVAVLEDIDRAAAIGAGLDGCRPRAAEVTRDHVDEGSAVDLDPVGRDQPEVIGMALDKLATAGTVDRAHGGRAVNRSWNPSHGAPVWPFRSTLPRR
jgi:hypothetical protein